MPIVDVEIVTSENERIGVTLAKDLAVAIGPILGSPPSGTWVRVRELPASHYAEGDDGGSGLRPAFVTVLRARIPAADALKAEIRALTNEVARVLGRSPENIHVLYAPEARGRAAFGGRFVEDMSRDRS
jgi:phenylpyruvate tautomerase PptA (4-oxalocrotonate tautomerase family)